MFLGDCGQSKDLFALLHLLLQFADNGTTTDWHLVTVTTQGGDWRGYRLFVDGQLAAEVAPGVQYVGRWLSICKLPVQ